MSISPRWLPFSKKCFEILLIFAIFWCFTNLQTHYFGIDDDVINKDFVSNYQRGFRRLVVYNRIPKTAGTSVVRIFESLRHSNDFQVVQVNVTNAIQFSSVRDHQLLIEEMHRYLLSNSVFLHGHIKYIEFEKFGSRLMPIYISLLRDPLERLVSKYYFIRFGDDHRPTRHRSRMANNSERWQTFDECVQVQNRDCRPELLWVQVPYLCGSAWFCSVPGNQLALKTAKRRLSEQYLLVGVTEQFDGFMNLLSRLLPEFLTGIEGTRNMTVDRLPIWHIRRTLRKQPVSEATRAFFTTNPIWLAERDLYEFARREFIFKRQGFMNSQLRHSISNLLHTVS